MFQRFHEMREQRESGFTLIELLVVILIIAILAAIAIPVFLRQREKGWVAGSQSALKNAATAAESYATGTGGDYSLLAGAGGQALLTAEGMQTSTSVAITVTSADTNDFCLTATHADLDVAHEWQVATYDSDEGVPSSGGC